MGSCLLEVSIITSLALNKIEISNYGAPVRKNPTIITSILISYYAGEPATAAARTRIPVIGDFNYQPYVRSKRFDLI